MPPLPQDVNPLALPDREEWRRWLQGHHDRETAAWLVIRRKGANVRGVAYEEAVEEALCFGWIDGQMHSVDRETFILRFSPRRPDGPWSLSNRERAEELIRRGRMTEAGMRKIEEAKRNGRWEAAYTSAVPPVVPPDLREALDQEAEAGANFDRFSNSDRLMYVAWVEGAKKPATRAGRIRQVVSRAGENLRPGR